MEEVINPSFERSRLKAVKWAFQATYGKTLQDYRELKRIPVTFYW
jgi:hypothetical protein